MVASQYQLELKEIYDRDFNQWLEITANLLKENKFSELDNENFISSEKYLLFAIE